MSITSIFNKLQNLISHNTYPKPASYLANDEFEFIIFPKQTTNQEKNTDFLAALDNSIKPYDEKSTRCNKKIVEAQAKYPFLNSKIIFQEAVKGQVDTLSISQIKYTDAEETFDHLDQLETLSDNELVEEILNMPEHELDEVFEKMTYAKLAELINNTSDEQAQQLVYYILPWHLEKVIDLITQDKLDKLFNENPNNLSLEALTEQELKKLSHEDISDEWFKNIIILAGEEKFAEKLDIIPNENLVRIISNISNAKLATIISHASDESIVRIMNINPKILPWLPFEKIKRITTLMDDEEVVEQLERQGGEHYKSSNEAYHENFVNKGSSIGLLGNSEKTGYNSDDSGIESNFDPNNNWIEYF
ncbi:hypothetical protein [Rickettsia australis]|uniref:Magnesium transporter MgtE intracellular domain-containing protein n=1 Tax=Rickettsia australis (strain Cutlack) TaxID=1105110 RepID=H8K755_RICAC|nr:hypothetical protein [Rickettsia australis]AFC71098.1 hypothetical protein MC5_03880 [Rickettsia australis str. Cutlack]